MRALNRTAAPFTRQRNHAPRRALFAHAIWLENTAFSILFTKVARRRGSIVIASPMLACHEKSARVFARA
jgi:hypothetical protein